MNGAEGGVSGLIGVTPAECLTHQGADTLEKPMAGMNAMELMDSTMLVAASSSVPIRPTIKMKKVKAKISRQNCIEPGMPYFISRLSISASSRCRLITE